jgi:uncharacterized protein (DUF2344 family)
MEFTQPLSLGIESSEELLALWLDHSIAINDEQALIDAFNEALPYDIRVTAVKLGQLRSGGKNSIGSKYWGSEYRVQFHDDSAAAKFEEFAQKKEIQFEAESKLVIALTLAETKDGGGSISKLLKEGLETDNCLEHCTVKRTRLLGRRSEESACESLANLL